MRQEFFWSVLVLVWIFGWATLWYLRRRGVEERTLKLRELLHRERMTAIEKGVPLPEIPTEEDQTPAWLRPEAERARSAWLRRISLMLGLLAVFVGLGMCVGFYWAPDRGFHEMWTIGIIPALGGVGLLLYAMVAPSVDR